MEILMDSASYYWFSMLLILPVVILYAFLVKFSVDRLPESVSRVALVIAHPDDEVMFFAPSLIKIMKQIGRENFYLVCITNGNHYDIGDIREKELIRSGQTMGIPRKNIVQVNDINFQDNPTVRWDVELLAARLKNVFTKADVNTVVCFSDYGVSGHVNHIDVHKAVFSLREYNLMFLKDVCLVRKYLSVIDVTCTWIFNKLFNKENRTPVCSVQMADMTQVHIQQSPFHVHSTPNNIPTTQTQLQFNLNAEENHQFDRIRKPRPIIIEKLLPKPPASQVQTGFLTDSIDPFQRQAETMLSSERLAMAVQLAKLDIRKLKTMLNKDSPRELIDDNVAERKQNSRKENRIPGKPRKENAEKVKTRKEPTNDIKSTQKEKKEKPLKRYEFQLYPEPLAKPRNKSTPVTSSRRDDNDDVGISESRIKEDKEIIQLQKELLNHSNILKEVVERLDEKTRVNIPNDDEESNEHRKRVKQAEEQKTRSLRMLYMLQQKINQLQKHHKQSRSGNTQPEKQTEYRQTLASAHRAALRTLQAFVSHAPLFYSTIGQLPSAYKELGLLIQQLTQLSINIKPGTSSQYTQKVIELIGLLNNIAREPSDQKPSKIFTTTTKNTTKTKQVYLKEHENWMQRKAEDLNMKSFFKGDSTPDRVSTLKHALGALDNEREIATKLQVRNVSPKRQQKKTKASVILPQRLKKKRFGKIVSTTQFQSRGPNNFAAPTVLSRIREKPPVERQEKDVHPTKVETVRQIVSSPGKEKDEKLVEQARAVLAPQKVKRQPPKSSSVSPRRSPVFLVDSTPYYYNSPRVNRNSPNSWNSPRSSCGSPRSISPLSNSSDGFGHMRKELYRQNWLDRLKNKEFFKLEKMGKVNAREFKKLKKEYDAMQSLVRVAEHEIQEKLKPLLDKAEEMALEEAKREQEHKTSIQKRLAALASSKALSEGERLAEYILDDLITEVAIELQQMEQENEAEVEAAFILDRPTLETISQRLDQFEEEEEKIRRFYKTVQYNSDTDLQVIPVKDENNSHGAPVTIFTQIPKSKPPVKEKAVAVAPDTSVKFDIPQGIASNIHLFKDRYEAYLKQSKYAGSGFDPWKLTEELSEEILDQLCKDVALEMSSMCDDFVEHVYEREFLDAKT